MEPPFYLPSPHFLVGPGVPGPSGSDQLWDLSQTRDRRIILATPRADLTMQVEREKVFRSAQDIDKEVLLLGQSLQPIFEAPPLALQPVNQDRSKLVVVTTHLLLPEKGDHIFNKAEVELRLHDATNRYLEFKITYAAPTGEQQSIKVVWVRERAADGYYVFRMFLNGDPFYSCTLSRYCTPPETRTRTGSLRVVKDALNLEPADHSNHRENMTVAITVYSALYIFRYLP